jgi:hypothetical protein
VKNIPWRLYASPVSRMLLDDKNLIRRALSLSLALFFFHDDDDDEGIVSFIFTTLSFSDPWGDGV